MRLQPIAGRRSQGAPAADHPRASGGKFRSGVRSGALRAMRRSVRSALPLPSARIAGDGGRAKKAHGLAIGREILGDRWARDHADDKKPVLAAALETAFDIQLNTACIGLEQAARDSAAAWLPPGMAYGDGAADDACADHPDQHAGSARIGDSATPPANDSASTDLPAI